MKSLGIDFDPNQVDGIPVRKPEECAEVCAKIAEQDIEPKVVTKELEMAKTRKVSTVAKNTKTRKVSKKVKSA